MSSLIFFSARGLRGLICTGCLFLLTLSVAAWPAPVAATTWTGSTNNVWSTGVPTNWSTGYSNGDDAIFNDSGANTSISVSGTVAPGSMTFANNSATYVIGGTAISGTGDLTKNGTGTVQLTVNNTFSGKTILNDGVLEIGADARLGTAPGAPVADQLTLNGGTLRSTATFALSTNRGITVNAGGGTIDVPSGTTTFHGNISGAGNLTKTGAGTFFHSPSVSNPFTGELHIEEGIVLVTSSSGPPATPFISIAQNGIFVEEGAMIQFNVGGNRWWVDDVTLRGGTFQDGPSTNNQMHGDIILEQNSFIRKTAATLTIAGDIVGPAGFEYVGTANLTIAGSGNTYAGPTTFSGGNATVNSGSSLGNTSALTVQNLNTDAGNNVTLALNNGAQTVGSLSGLIATPSSGVNNATINLGTNYDLTINQTTDGTYQGTINGGSAEIILGASSTAALRLEGVNTYGAGTTINGGALLVNNTSGSGTGSGNVTVNSTGLLGGTGTIAGSVDVNSGATLNPGDVTGTLTVNGAGGVDLNAGSIFAVDLGGSAPGTFDQLVVTNTANISGSTLDVTFLGGELQSNDSVVILSAGTLVGTFANAPDEGSQLSFNGVSFLVSYLDNQVTLSNFSVPEPSSLVLLGLGTVLLARKRRRARAS